MLCFKNNKLFVGCCDRHQLDQTSTRGSKFGRNVDQTSTPPVSKFGRSSVKVWCRSLVDVLSNLHCIALLYRANFYQTSTLGVSKFGRYLVEVSTLGVSKFCRNVDQISTPTSFKIDYFI